ncbi:histone-lysine N-methyltransferase SETMAR-like [Pseudomyrmex gracilis]|uniref:histone-lysine N-methyltransferase SETMAR-like n=1 Tax=Pseudomyrmex gracilis TaxID=219809 RepID=UPI00099506C3|nr:histone-lysine N-methyltransferase SETMAR-like [Pseudomyrmex gracilis]
MYGASALSADTCERWFASFRSEKFNLQDAPRSGRPNSVDDNQLVATVKSDRHVTTREIAKRFGIHHTIFIIQVMNRLEKLGMVKKLDVWVPHELNDKNIMDRILVCESLLKQNSLDPFLKRIITGDKKWVVYNNITAEVVVRSGRVFTNGGKT